jgi:hypothetical protein
MRITCKQNDDDPAFTPQSACGRKQLKLDEDARRDALKALAVHLTGAQIGLPQRTILLSSALRY